jgi:hypothetical protein
MGFPSRCLKTHQAEHFGQGDPAGSLAPGLDSLRVPPGDPQIRAKESLEGGVGESKSLLKTGPN